MTAGNQFRCQPSPSAHTGLGSARLHSDNDDDDDDDDGGDDDGSEEKRVVLTMRYVVTTFNVCTLINKKNSDDLRDVVHTYTVSQKKRHFRMLLEPQCIITSSRQPLCV